MLRGPVLPFAREHLELCEPGGPKEQVRAEGRPAGQVWEAGGKVRVVVGGVKGAQSQEACWASPELRSGGPGSANFSKGGGKRFCRSAGLRPAEARQGSNEDPSAFRRWRRRWATSAPATCWRRSPCARGRVRPSCPAPRRPARHLFHKVALVEGFIEQLQLVAQVGLPPAFGLFESALVAKLVVKCLFR